MDTMDRRDEFLLKMYEQMFNDIDRHHKIVWQVIGVLIGSFAVVALAEKELIPIDIAVAVVILISLWVIAHVYDSNYWYNRNLVIISNIERQFLKKEDLKEIQYYFGEHRDKNAVQTSLKIQLYVGWGLVVLFLSYHFITEIYPGFFISWADASFDWMKMMPYIVLIVFYLKLVKWIKKKRENDYEEFVANSPGIEIDTSSINYGGGHPISKK
ncbi:hypothetical protein ACFOSV_13975 [Algoriphagus namhaensis]|uniref:Uncharacterized protein n=1 Tax=Algoriphagus namhaensis TaxID=915353 RepID=A0ABV8AWR5_9BACT